MDSSFIDQIAEQHQQIAKQQPDSSLENWAEELIHILFPTHLLHLQNSKEIQGSLKRSQKTLLGSLTQILKEKETNLEEFAHKFYSDLPNIYQDLKLHAAAILKKEKTVKSVLELSNSSFEFRALCYYRIARYFTQTGLQEVANLITQKGFKETSIRISSKNVIEPGVILAPGTSVIGVQSLKAGLKINPIQRAKEFTQLVGNTPMVELKRIFSHPKVKILAKLEGNNPCGSIKDRPALYMVRQAFKRGDLKEGMKIIEITSGNTGIALAMISSIYGFQSQFIMPNWVSIERAQIMEAFGAKVHCLDTPEGFMSLKHFLNKRMQEESFYHIDQFNNGDNFLAHYETTGPEIYRDTQGKVTHFVASMGTTGTISGVGKYLKEQNPEIQVIGVQPADGEKIQGTIKWPQGSPLVPKIYNSASHNLKVDANEAAANEMARRLAAEQGIFCGQSSGGAVAAAVALAKTLEEGLIVVIICDRGDRYLTTPIFNRPGQN